MSAVDSNGNAHDSAVQLGEDMVDEVVTQVAWGEVREREQSSFVQTYCM